MSSPSFSLPNQWRRGLVEVFPDNETESLEKRLGDRPLRVKLGIDPTRPDLHLGHAVVLRKLRQFQDAGHKAVLIIGNFTAQIGDPTGKSEARPRLTPAEVSENAKTYFEQAKKILDFSPDRLEIHYNQDWLGKFQLDQVVNLLATMTVGQMLAKEDFHDRYQQGTPIYLHEFLYPLLQGYDSVQISADAELGGSDQKFNILVGRDLQLHMGKQGQFGLITNLLVGLDGHQKMSKSLDNYVGLNDEPLLMYSKLEKVPDHLVDKYFELLTDVDLATLPTNPREKQKLLALTITAQYHSFELAKQAQQDAEQIVLAGNTSQLGNIPTFSVSGITFPTPLFYLLKVSGLCKSNSEAQSQITNGAVRIDGEKITDPYTSYASPDLLYDRVLQVGKKKFLKLVP
ncbi:MAG: tyrosine--tRNA ligase [Pseudanabaenaceae cyanobacterium]